MGIAPVQVVFAAIYHWFPLMTGRMYNETLGRLHFWFTFLGSYLIYFPMHYLGLIGVPRRYYEMGQTEALYTQSAADLNVFITLTALVTGFAQIFFFINIFWSRKHGAIAEKNPWQANSLEWRTPSMPPGHGNFGKELPVVFRWPYDFNVPGAKDDFVPQDVPNSEVELAEGYEGTEIKAEQT